MYGLKRSPKHWYEKAKTVFKSMGLKSIPNFPCLFTGIIIPNKPPLCLGLYVDDFICLSNSPEVEKIFEDKLNIFLQVELSSPPQILLGLKIRTYKEDNDMSIFLSQQATTEELIHAAGLIDISATTQPTPYISGYPVGKPKCDERDLPQQVKVKLEDTYRSAAGSLNWLSTVTRLDIATIANIFYRHTYRNQYLHI